MHWEIFYLGKIHQETYFNTESPAQACIGSYEDPLWTGVLGVGAEYSKLV